MAVVSFTLEANKTYPHRIILWNRLTFDGARCAGVLEIRESKTPSGKARVRRYAVQEQKKIGDEFGRRFKFTKPLGSAKEGEDKEHYVFFNDPKQNSLMSCQCKGYIKEGKCAHTQSLKLLYDKGQLPTPNPLQPT